ncbi:hypothetical protein [Nocardiopsis lambiniae]|uniref:DUF2127 domain-containing protein n=1 Tax=Nocardiopsis lambiniae TaxID=3075539 RepID=A0ABU2MHX3_9ACTN|nr:hypothetical protein [Nocardiopsis sp. DSM 44743]MDT0331670.1 hypothetical protein [Nocardiopsis sp. DSM 44743]
MSPSGQDPYEPDGIPPQRGLPDFEAGFAALHPDAPLPRRVAVVRILMFIGGACGIALSLLLLQGLVIPQAQMEEALAAQAQMLGEQGVQLEISVEMMRSLIIVMAAVTGVYGVLSTLLAARIRRRTLGVFWGVVLFQGAAGALLLWNLLSGALEAVVPLGFAVYMITVMFSREARAHYGLL